jgi:hypothetical protein
MRTKQRKVKTHVAINFVDASLQMSGNVLMYICVTDDSVPLCTIEMYRALHHGHR